MSTKYDVLVDRLAGTPRAASAAAGELERQTIRDTFAARDAFLDAVPPPGAADRDIANLLFASRVDGVPGSGANALLARQGAREANQIRLDNRGAAAQAMEKAAAVGLGGTQLAQTIANRPMEEIRFLDAQVETMLSGGLSELQVAKFVERQALVLESDAAKEYARILVGDLISEGAKKAGGAGTSVKPIGGGDPAKAQAEQEDALRSALGEPV